MHGWQEKLNSLRPRCWCRRLPPRPHRRCISLRRPGNSARRDWSLGTFEGFSHRVFDPNASSSRHVASHLPRLTSFTKSSTSTTFRTMPRARTLSRAPAVAFLLRAWRLPAEDWDFAQVVSVLRSSYFRPNWPEVRDDPEVAVRAEALLRMLGETRGRDAYMRAVATWEQLPPEPLEDEQPEEPLRRRKQRLARECRPFLERFFAAWQVAIPAGSASAAVAQFKSFAETIGLLRAPPDDLSALMLFWGELDRWAQTSFHGRKLVKQEHFTRVLNTLAQVPGRARSVRGRGVVLLSAERAVGLSCDCLCLVGLGEGSWPDLTAPILCSMMPNGNDSARRALRFRIPRRASPENSSCSRPSSMRHAANSC